jgi:hypothetical protein
MSQKEAICIYQYQEPSAIACVGGSEKWNEEKQNGLP